MIRKRNQKQKRKKDKGLPPLGPRCGCDDACFDSAHRTDARRFDDACRNDDCGHDAFSFDRACSANAFRFDDAHRADARRFDDVRSSGDCGHDACCNVAIRFDDAHHAADNANRYTPSPPHRGKKRRSSIVPGSLSVSHNAITFASARHDVFSAPSPCVAPRAPRLYPHPLEIGIAFLAGALNQGEGAWPCRRPVAWRITSHKTLHAACGPRLRATAGAVTAKKTPRRTWLIVGRFFLRPARCSEDVQSEDEARKANYRSRVTMPLLVCESGQARADVVTRRPALAVACVPAHGRRGPQNGDKVGAVDVMNIAPLCGLRWGNREQGGRAVTKGGGEHAGT